MNNWFFVSGVALAGALMGVVITLAVMGNARSDATFWHSSSDFWEHQTKSSDDTTRRVVNDLQTCVDQLQAARTVVAR